MTDLLTEIFKREFVVNEPREEIVEPVQKQRGRKKAAREAGGTEPASNDLASQICVLLLDKDRLERLTEELRNRTSKPGKEDLSRMFRLSLTVFDSFERMLQMAESQPPFRRSHFMVEKCCIRLFTYDKVVRKLWVADDGPDREEGKPRPA